MNGLALQVQEALGRDPHAGDLYVFRGKRGGRVTFCTLLVRDPAAAWSHPDDIPAGSSAAAPLRVVVLP
ncbi:transposase, partial [Roseomonas sp. ACRSG]|nr:transposase [Roseomonas sp. ACRSG]